ncbi:MAG: ribonuclease HI family protein [Candidatus Omnitrophica bacterium]|nr:ribonuclease HI family protein [Candidatus Omnitrophota bacterium]
MPERLLIYIDGAARGNPGPAGIGVVILDENKNKVKEYSKHLGSATNNTAEYNALIYALQEAHMLGVKDVVLHTDSELVAKQLKGEFRVKNANIKPLFEQAVHLINGFEKVEVKRIDRSLNKEADRLANKAINLSGLKTKIE